MNGLRPLPAPLRLGASAFDRVLRLPPARNQVLLERDVQVPTRDGETLLADHYAPGERPDRPTVLIRTPYGRDPLPWGLFCIPFAARGYHVLNVSCRGTFGSSGAFEPMQHEVGDGQDVVGWLRGQPWFDGRLATWGPSYLGFTQWALALHQPPELRAMVAVVAVHDIAQSAWGDGPFTELTVLHWANGVAHQEHGSALGRLLTGMRQRPERQLAADLARLPLPDGADQLGGDPVPFYRQWAEHQDLDDPFWTHGQRLGAVLETATAPTLLIGGWSDLFLEQTLAQYDAFRHRDVPVRLVVGPWTHGQTLNARLFQESLAWFDHHVSVDGAPPPRASVRFFVTGAARWLDSSTWPGPLVEPVSWHLAPGDLLTRGRRAASRGQATFRYDPADPTPAAGGRTLAPSAGTTVNNAVEARDDVLVFTSPPLESPLELRGRPRLTLQVRADSPFVDLFCRLCDVDPGGVSRNVSDRIVRRDAGGVEPGRVETVVLALDPLAHRFLSGHRLRLQIAGGAYPRFSRNLGTGEPAATGIEMLPTEQTIYFDDGHPSWLDLPVVRAPDPG